MSTVHGTPAVWGVVPIKPIVTDIPGRMRIRLRNNYWGCVFIKSPTGIRGFILGVKDDGTWFPAFEQGRNERTEIKSIEASYRSPV